MSMKELSYLGIYQLELPIQKLNYTAVFVFRGYTEKKVQENVQCEIFQTILEEAKESYKHEIVNELNSNTPDDMEDNLTRILQWVQQWHSEH